MEEEEEQRRSLIENILPPNVRLDPNGWYTMNINTFISLKLRNIIENETISRNCIRQPIRIGPGINRNRRNELDETSTRSRNMIEDDVQDISKLYSEIFDGNLNGAVNFEITYNSENVGDFYFIYIYPNNQRRQNPVDMKGY